MIVTRKLRPGTCWATKRITQFSDGTGGEILAETDASGNTTAEYIFFGGKRIAMLPASSTPIYYVEDMLGTSRVIATNTGTVCYDADFYPYGGERSYTNTCPQNYKFEGKERDTETGNDDFGARYYSNRFGRWLSADWSSVPAPVPYANLTNPQTLNLYPMVADDPETFADLDGHTPGTIAAVDTCGGRECDGANSDRGSKPEAKTNEQQEKKPLISISVEGGYGLEGHVNLGPLGEAKGGGALKGELEVSPDGTKVSAKAEVGGKIGPIKLPGVEAEKVTKNEQGESEKATLKFTKPGFSKGNSEVTGGQGEVKIGVSAYVGPGAGVSVTIRLGAIIDRTASAVGKFLTDATFGTGH